LNSPKKIVQDNFEIEIFSNDYYLCKVNGTREFVIDDLIKLVEAQKQLGAFKMPILVLCDIDASTNTDLLNYVSKNANSPYVTSDAFVIKSLSQRILANFYLKVNLPERPTKFFNNSKDAISWLNQFI